MKCSRCNGRGVYIVRVVNGHGVPATPANGTCYRCHGTGKEPYYKEETMMSKLTVKEAVFQVLQQVNAVSDIDKEGELVKAELKEVTNPLLKEYGIPKAFTVNAIKKLIAKGYIEYAWMGEIGEWKELYVAITNKGYEKLVEIWEDTTSGKIKVNDTDLPF